LLGIARRFRIEEYGIDQFEIFAIVFQRSRKKDWQVLDQQSLTIDAAF
jgi:hypothetical protein